MAHVLFEGVSSRLKPQSLDVPPPLRLTEAEAQSLRSAGVPIQQEDEGATLRMDLPTSIEPGSGEIFCFTAVGGALTVLAGWRREEAAFSWQPPRDVPFMMPRDLE